MTVNFFSVSLLRWTARPLPEINVSSTVAIKAVVSGTGNVTQSTSLSSHYDSFHRRHVLTYSNFLLVIARSLFAASVAVAKGDRENYYIY